MGFSKRRAHLAQPLKIHFDVVALLPDLHLLFQCRALRVVNQALFQLGLGLLKSFLPLRAATEHLYDHIKSPDRIWTADVVDGQSKYRLAQLAQFSFRHIADLSATSPAPHA